MATTRKRRAREFSAPAARARRLRTIAAFVSLAALSVGGAAAQEVWRFTPTLGSQVSWTSNVDLAPSDQQRSDLVFIVTPGVSIDRETARSLLRGYVNVPISLYTRTGEENNEVSPQANLLGRATLVDRFLFIEGQATVQQSYLNPFGPRPADLINATDNRYTAQTYRVTPYIEGWISNNVRYLLKNDNIWTNATGSPSTSEYSYTNRLYGYIERDPLPFGWRVLIDRNAYRFEGQTQMQLLELARATAIYQYDPTLQFLASGGYERNRFPLSSYEGAIYGGGVRWRPSERTILDAGLEHRFFGTSYLVDFEHRTPLSVWALNAKRAATTYPEQSIAMPAGTSVTGALDNILRSRIPDPTERAQFIAEFISDRGLPDTLVDPLALYSQLLYLQESVAASAGFLGARNALFFNAFWLRSEAISAAGDVLPPVVGGFNNNTQTGGSIVWSYRLTPLTSVTASGSYTRTEAIPPLSDASDQYIARLLLTRPLSPKTRAYAGARFQKFESNVDPDYHETAVFVGLNYSFR